MATATVRRDQLYQQLWSMPGQKLAALYGISDVGLAKACKRYDIPRPPRGYWARIAVGQKIRRPSLPKTFAAKALVHFTGWTMTDETFNAASSETPPKTAAPSDINPAVVEVRSQLLAAKPRLDGRVSASALAVSVSPKQAERCAAILDQLIRRWAERNGRVETVSDKGETETFLSIGPDRFSVSLEELVDDTKAVTDPSHLTERLVINVQGHEHQQFRRRWADTKTQRLERMLGLLVETIAAAIGAEKQLRLDAECIERQKQKVAAVRKKSSAKESREFYIRQHLMQDVSRWHDAERIRAYLFALDLLVKKGRCPIDAVRSAEWMAWARSFADSIDPLINAPLPDADSASTRPNVVVLAELDLTSGTKAVVNSLGVTDSDGLARIKQDKVREHCSGGFGKTWNEITRTLEGLGYDVSKREAVSDWW